MLWSMIRLIFKTSSVTPDFFYVFILILSFSTCSQSFEKICTWEHLGGNVLKSLFFAIGMKGIRDIQFRPMGPLKWPEGQITLDFLPDHDSVQFDPLPESAQKIPIT